MRKAIVISLFSLAVIISVSFTKNEISDVSLRNIYFRQPGSWPRPLIDPGVSWSELGLIPDSPVENQKDSLKYLIELGKVLFFDTRLSGSGKISCATCHQPELSWTDGKEKSLGHEGAINKRNSPTILNSWFYSRLFWDGRAKDLQDQAFAPINSESEMFSEMPEVIRKLRKIKGYADLFEKAYGDDEINPDRMTEAISIFEKTIVSRKSRFDEFLEGKKRALTNSELRGLHLFRTKARCMNCHNGPMFTDNQFHNNGFHLYGKPENDKGLYNVTHKDEDIGKFKTPSLRDAMRTGPWMHNGMMTTMREVVSHYNKGADAVPSSDRLIETLFLTFKEQEDLLAFLNAISSRPLLFTRPKMPD